MPSSRLGAAVAVLFMLATPAMAQQVISEPGIARSSTPWPIAEGGYTDPIISVQYQYGSRDHLGVTGKRSRTHRSSATRMQ